MVSAIAAASAYSGRSEKPVQDVSTSRPRKRRVPRPLRPAGRDTTSLPWPACSEPTCRARRTTCPLKAPARPRSPVSTMTPTRLGSRRSSSGSPCTCAREAASIIKSRMRSAYGRSASIRSCARRSFEAETSSSAFVILRVLRTDEMRRLMSPWLAMALRGGAHQTGLLADLEALRELLDGLPERGHGVVGEVAAVADRRQHLLLGAQR